VEVSAVLAAMAVPLEWAMGTVRFSVGRGTTAEEVDRAIDVVARAIRRLERQAAMVDRALLWDESEQG
jgi:cysteine desulfurase